MRFRLTLLALLFLSPAFAAAARADDLMGGLRFGYYSDAEEPFLGAELLAHLDGPVYFNPNVEYVFTQGYRYVTFNADFHYDFPRHGRTYAWLGGGLAIATQDPEGPAEADTDAGLNLLGGIGLRRGGVVPYVQLKAIIKDDSEAVLAVGLRF